MTRGRYGRKRMAILERELERYIELRTVAYKVAPGETLLVSYWPDLKFIDGDDILEGPPEQAHIEATYKEVRLALARLVLKGVIK